MPVRVLEEGDTAMWLAKPRHPYTRALLAATRAPTGRPKRCVRCRRP